MRQKRIGSSNLLVSANNMKIAITGHTRGIGQAITQQLGASGHEIHGISKSNGYDLTFTEARDQAFDIINNSDVFINNCYPMLRSRSHRVGSWAPIELLYRVHEAWRGQANKRIIVIGSLAIQQSYAGANPYQIHKQAINQVCIQLRSSFKFPMITTINPGDTKTERLRKIVDSVLDPADIARLVQFTLTDPLYIRDLTFSAWPVDKTVDSTGDNQV